MILVSLGCARIFSRYVCFCPLWGTVEFCPEGTIGLSLGFQPQVPINKTPRPEGAVEPVRRVCRVDQWSADHKYLPPLQHPYPLRRCNSDLAQYSNTPARNASRSDAGGPSLRAAGFEDEDDDEDENENENEAPCGGGDIMWTCSRG